VQQTESAGAANRECGCRALRVPELMLTINSHRVEISIAGCVEEMVLAQITLLFCLFLFSFIVFRYKKLRTALSMERTKPRNHKPNTKETIFPVLPQSLKILARTIRQRSHTRILSERKLLTDI